MFTPSTGSTILACSTVVYNDIFLRFVRGTRSAGTDAAASTGEIDLHGRATVHKDVWINRVIALTIGLFTVLLAVVISDIFKALDLSYAFLSGCVFVPVIASFLLKKVSPRAGLVSLALSAAVVAGTMAYGETTGQAEYAIGGNWPIRFGIIVGLLSYIALSLLDRNKITPNVEVEQSSEMQAYANLTHDTKE